jgi:hypothetical protein
MNKILTGLPPMVISKKVRGRDMIAFCERLSVCLEGSVDEEQKRGESNELEDYICC